MTLPGGTPHPPSLLLYFVTSSPRNEGLQCGGSREMGIGPSVILHAIRLKVTQLSNEAFVWQELCGDCVLM